MNRKRPLISVYDSKKGINTVCCMAIAARIVGIDRHTLEKWYYSGKKEEEFNHFRIMLRTEVLKQSSGRRDL